MLKNRPFFIWPTQDRPWFCLLSAKLLILSSMHNSCCMSHFTFRASHFSSCHLPNTDLLGSAQIKVLTCHCSSLTVGAPCLSAPHTSITRSVPGYFGEIQAQLSWVTYVECHSTVWMRMIIYLLLYRFPIFPSLWLQGTQALRECSFSNKTSKYIYFYKELDKLEHWRLCGSSLE